MKLVYFLVLILNKNAILKFSDNSTKNTIRYYYLKTSKALKSIFILSKMNINSSNYNIKN